LLISNTYRPIKVKTFTVNILAKITTIPFLLAFNLKNCPPYGYFHAILLFPEIVSLFHESKCPVIFTFGNDLFHRHHPGRMFS